MLALALCNLACPAPKLPAQGARLLDPATVPEVTWPADFVLPESGLRGGDDLATYDPAGPPYIARVRLGEVFTREERLALVAPQGSIFRYNVAVPERGSLRFGVGVLDGTGKGGSVCLQIRIGRAGDAVQPVFARGLPVRADYVDPETGARESAVLYPGGPNANFAVYQMLAARADRGLVIYAPDIADGEWARVRDGGGVVADAAELFGPDAEELEVVSRGRAFRVGRPARAFP